MYMMYGGLQKCKHSSLVGRHASNVKNHWSIQLNLKSLYGVCFDCFLLPCRWLGGSLGVDEVVVVVDGVATIVLLAVFLLQVHQEVVVGSIQSAFL